MNLVKRYLFLILSICCYPALAQTTGGNAAFNFLKLPGTPTQSAVGFANPSIDLSDVGMTSYQPALLKQELHKQVAFSFNSFFAGSKAYHLAGVYHSEKRDITFGGAIFFVDHGNIPQTDAAGNQSGQFHPREFYIQASASKKYLNRWRYGVTTRIAHSDYGQYQSTALLFDVGLHYSDTAKGLTAGLLANNMGVQLSAFGDDREDLPFDLQAGITKKMAKAPFGFSLTAQQMHRFRLGYNDTTFNRDNGYPVKRNSFGRYFFNHFIIASHFYLSPNLEFHAGYNRLRREELNIGSGGNGLNGFSAGLRIRFKKIQLQFSRAWYQSNQGYNHAGIGLDMRELSGL